jgi:hypothetical protein
MYGAQAEAVKWQTDGALAEALDAALDCLEAGRVWGSGLLDCLDYLDVIAAELRYRGLLRDPVAQAGCVVSSRLGYPSVTG